MLEEKYRQDPAMRMHLLVSMLDAKIPLDLLRDAETLEINARDSDALCDPSVHLRILITRNKLDRSNGKPVVEVTHSWNNVRFSIHMCKAEDFPWGPSRWAEFFLEAVIRLSTAQVYSEAGLGPLAEEGFGAAVPILLHEREYWIPSTVP